MGIDDTARIQIAIKSILIRSARIVGNLYATTVSCGIIVYIEVRCLVKPMEQRSDCRGTKVIMNIGKAEEI